MGQDISTLLTLPPLSLQDCLVNDQIDIACYIYYQCKIDIISYNDHIFNHILKRKHNIKPEQSKPRKKISLKRYKLLARNADGRIRELTPKDTLW